MSDILPKFKVFMFVAVISFLINLSVLIAKMSIKASDFSGLIINFAGLSIGSFVPFVNLLVLADTGFPFEVVAFLTMVMVILAGIELFIIVMFGLQLISNILWHPDV